ncbi:MAG: ABC transporter ATP-binding protein [Bacteroidetes bacterium]|nr:ABC transporter ATP-binding protein [Bacteroidota bacterium]
MLFRLQNVRKEYIHQRGARVMALDNITLDIEQGEFLVVTGPSGSGKSTLLFTIGGLLRPSSGTIHFGTLGLHDADDARLSDFRRTHIGYVMQNFFLVPYLTAEENVMVACALSEPEVKLQREKSVALLDRVGLLDRRHHHPRELSAGQQQRVAIARALANDPSVILADEPTGNLDPSLANDILTQLRVLNDTDGLTIVMVTHSPTANTFGTSHIRLHDGAISLTPDAVRWTEDLPVREVG